MAGTCTHLGKLIGSFFTSRHWCLWLLVHSGCPWTKDAIAAMPVARQKERPTNYFSLGGGRRGGAWTREWFALC